MSSNNWGKPTVVAFVAALAISHGKVAFSQAVIIGPPPSAGQSSIYVWGNAYHDFPQLYQTGLPATPLLGAISAADSDSAGLSTVVLSAIASGRAEAKSVGVSTVASASAYSPYAGYGTGAIASAHAWVDVPFLVNHAQFNGTSGTMQALLNISGTVSLGSGLLADPSLGAWSPYSWGQSRVHVSATGLAPGPSGSGHCGHDSFLACRELVTGYVAGSSGFSSSGSGANGNWLLNIPFTFGSWSSYRLDIVAYSNVNAVGGNGTSVSLTGSAKYNQSADWGGITGILDANGSQVTGWSVHSVTGVDLLTPVPEPETYALLLAGLAVIVGVVRSRKTVK